MGKELKFDVCCKLSTACMFLRLHWGAGVWGHPPRCPTVGGGGRAVQRVPEFPHLQAGRAGNSLEVASSKLCQTEASCLYHLVAGVGQARLGWGLVA